MASRLVSTAGRGNFTKIGWVKCGCRSISSPLGSVASLIFVAGDRVEYAGRGQLIHVHAAEDRRPRVADDPPLHLRAELLRGKEHETQIPAALRQIEQHLPNVGVGAVGRRVLVELVHEDHDVVDAQLAPLEIFAQRETTRAKTRSCANGSRPATSTTWTLRSPKAPQGRSLAAPSSVTSPFERVEILLSRFRTFRIVAT